MNDSILTSIKKLLGIPADYTHFDEDILTQINMAFSTLKQLGVGPEDGFTVEDKNDFWDDYMDEGPTLNMVKTYIQLKVRQTFDPPTISAVLTSLESQIAELEWRLLVECDPDSTNEGEEE